jgi:hypothetical protein
VQVRLLPSAVDWRPWPVPKKKHKLTAKTTMVFFNLNSSNLPSRLDPFVTETGLKSFFRLYLVPRPVVFIRKLGALVFKPFSYSSRPWSGHFKPSPLIKLSPSSLVFIGDFSVFPKQLTDWVHNHFRWLTLIRQTFPVYSRGEFAHISLVAFFGFLESTLFSRFWGTVFRFIPAISFTPSWGFGFSSPEEVSLSPFALEFREVQTLSPFGSEFRGV